jgi:lipopolysaccharide/colanic/teichoic acid biosynthesis glycosyltransferase
VSTLPTTDSLPFIPAPHHEGSVPEQERAALPRGLIFESSSEFLRARRTFLSEIAALPRPRRGYFVAKRAIDLTLAVIIGLIALPIALPIALAIKLYDRGPIFFQQQRTGLGGYRFRMLKFRTMCVNADQMKTDLQHLSLVAYPDFKMDDDPRITPIGRFLRATFLDELPQLLNVIRGEMSIVGPRPTSFAASTYSLWHTERLEAKPGITGLWQVRRDAGETCFDQRLRLDVEYLRTRTTLGDVRLVLETVASTFRRAGR